MKTTFALLTISTLLVSCGGKKEERAEKAAPPAPVAVQTCRQSRKSGPPFMKRSVASAPAQPRRSRRD